MRTLTLELLERWHMEKLMEGAVPTEAETKLADDARAALQTLSDTSATSADLAFLEKPQVVDVDRLRVPLTLKEVVEERLEEIEACRASGAPLAVIFLAGSTLEGLLYEVAQTNIEAYNANSAAPRDRDGRVRPLPGWTLENLITVSRKLGVVGEDVVKHAHGVKEFRNYIHPRQQIKENFTPRSITADIARQVLRAAIADLGGSVSTLQPSSD